MSHHYLIAYRFSSIDISNNLQRLSSNPNKVELIKDEVLKFDVIKQIIDNHFIYTVSKVSGDLLKIYPIPMHTIMIPNDLIRLITTYSWIGIMGKVAALEIRYNTKGVPLAKTFIQFALQGTGKVKACKYRLNNLEVDEALEEINKAIEDPLDVWRAHRHDPWYKHDYSTYKVCKICVEILLGRTRSSECPIHG